MAATDSFVGEGLNPSPYKEMALIVVEQNATIIELRAQLREARAICYAWERRCDEVRAKLERCEGLLRETRGYMLPDNPRAGPVMRELAGRIDVVLAEQEPRT